MTRPRMNFTELLEKHHDEDLLRAIDEGALQLLMETNVDSVFSAGVTNAPADARHSGTGTAIGHWARCSGRRTGGYRNLRLF